MTRSELLKLYPDEVIFDIIVVLHAWLLLPDLLKQMRILPDYLGLNAAFTLMMLFFLVLPWHMVPVLKSLKANDRKATSGIGSFLLFIVILVALIEGPALLAVYTGGVRHVIECRFMLIGIIMIIIGLVAGNLMPLLRRRVIAKIGDSFIGEMISLGLVNAGAAAAASLVCFYNLIMVAYFSVVSPNPLGGYILSLALSGVVTLRLIMMSRSPARPVTILTGVASIALCVLSALVALGRI
ncbi:MAG: hypothetical protein JW838_08380 [Spirochaetes bacterium]|nr:hypothetical protein [Spirochaetota bacterium]